MGHPEFGAAHNSRRQFVRTYATTIDRIITSSATQSSHKQALKGPESAMNVIDAPNS
ncbi:hypothetical protein [Paraburkholderia sp. SG-MS1]|uniref:hypothetical protein n=1 Tax=Paraburkholderia sp. SG-MS1 TaxID=2023741 RepID=UPI001EEAC894|nr:hypothetical protein [Paraburkholderia sp. SG-MS1]